MGMRPQNKLLTPINALWALSDGRAGHDTQSLALASALATELDLTTRILTVKWPPPWRWLAPRSTMGLSRLCRAWPMPLPGTLVIGCGRHAALANRWLKQRHGKDVTTLQILNPRIASHYFDYLIVPEHDGLTGPNIITSTGSLTPVNDRWLQQGERQWHEPLSNLPRPRHTVLLGGAAMETSLEIIKRAKKAATAAQGSILLSTSRRTPRSILKRVRALIEPLPNLIYTGDGPNPYTAMLAAADQIWVSADSINMICESLASGRKTQICGTPPTHRHQRFIDTLISRQWLNDKRLSANHAHRPPMRETERIAAMLIRGFYSAPHSHTN